MLATKKQVSTILLNNNCLNILKELQDNSIAAVIADPPYNIGMTHNGRKGTSSDLNLVIPFFSELFQQLKRVLKPDGEIYMFTDFRTIPMLAPLLEEFLNYRNCIVWDKLSGPGNFFSYSHEFILFGTHHSPQYNRNKNGRNLIALPSFASGAAKTNGKKVHPTQKPKELIQHLISSTIQSPQDWVLDPFAGYSTTGFVCQQMGVNSISVEIQAKWAKKSAERLGMSSSEILTSIRPITPAKLL